MHQQIENIIKTRKFLLEQIGELSNEELNTIPPGFNNNIIWNLGHLVAAQQGVCYLRGGIPAITDAAILSTYKSGTKPERTIEPVEIENIKKLLISSIEQLQEDYRNNIFGGYKAWSTRYTVDIKNIEDGISFLMFHEGLHSGVIAAQKKLVQKK